MVVPEVGFGAITVMAGERRRMRLAVRVLGMSGAGLLRIARPGRVSGAVRRPVSRAWAGGEITWS